MGEIIVIRNAHYYNENLFFHIASIDSSTNSITVLEDIPDTNFSVSYAAAIVPNDSYGQHAEGAGNIAHGDFSHVEGYQNISNGNSSHAEGQGTTALHDQSHAEGCETTASGTASHAEGLRATASGHYSHAEGQNTTATHDYSHAEGCYTNANSQAGHAEGCRTTAKDFIPTLKVIGQLHQIGLLMLGERTIRLWRNMDQRTIRQGTFLCLEMGAKRKNPTPFALLTREKSMVHPRSKPAARTMPNISSGRMATPRQKTGWAGLLPCAAGILELPSRMTIF